MSALWPNGESYPGDVWHEYGPRKPIWTPNGYTSNFHGGIDIGPWDGIGKTWLLAPVSGEVVYATYDPIFGNRVVVRGGGADFWLCHGRHGSMQVRRGDWVTQKQRLMLMGETGKASGEHIHYEIHVNGVRVDPRAFYRSAAAAGGSASAIPEEEEEEDMYIANVKNGNFYLVIGTKAHALGKASGARESGIPIINYVDDWAVAKLKSVVTGIA